jgi:thiol-disulfide isomerase/thioredoxin
MNAGDEADVEEDFDFNFTAYSLDGKLLTKDSLKNKVVFLNMWATWCGPCRAEMPTIQSLHDGIKNDNIVFVMLAIDRVDPERKVKNYIAKSNYTFPVYILKGEPPVQMRVPTIPTTFIISKEGKLLRKEVGMKNYDTERFKNFLLKEAE